VRRRLHTLSAAAALAWADLLVETQYVRSRWPARILAAAWPRQDQTIVQTAIRLLSEAR